MSTKIESLLYQALLELSYVQSVENCKSGLCATALGEEIIRQGMILLGVPDLSQETLQKARQKVLEAPRG